MVNKKTLNFFGLIGCLLSASWSPLVLGVPYEDKVEGLPGLDSSFSLQQYSGYLNASTSRHFHYWLIEAANNPEDAPLILWLNGGPGCSSVSGLMTENGPFSVSQNDPGVLEPNKYSWNLVGNILYLESPACVGFSFDDNFNCVTGDSEVAELNYNALLHFFEKFPEYNDRDFFITGESYAGIYIPTLSVAIAERRSDFPGNFKGYAIGNGLLSYAHNDHSLLYFGYAHGLIGEHDWDKMMKACCAGINVSQEEKCDFDESNNRPCSDAVGSAFNVIYDSNVNIYNLYGKCEHGSPSLHSTNRYQIEKMNLFQKYKMSKLSASLKDDPPCMATSRETNYLNREDVRAALNIPRHVQRWETCSDGVFMNYDRELGESYPLIGRLRNLGIRGLIYNGDVDMACNFLGNEWSLATLNMTLLDYRRSWTVNRQVAGYVSRYSNLDFVTVKGSGHMVPTDKPAEALHLLHAFVNSLEY